MYYDNIYGMSKFTSQQMWSESKADLLKLKAAYLANGEGYSLSEILDRLIKKELKALEALKENSQCDT